MADELLSGTVTFLFTDIEGSTQLVRRLRDGYAAVLADHGRALEGAIEEHGGRVVDTQGDAYFSVFPRAKDAVEAAAAAQRALAEHDWPEDGEVRVRMGLHTGEPVVGEGRYVGLGVNRAARICAAGHGGQVLLSSATRAVAEDDLPEDWVLRDLGQHQLKDLPRPEHVFQLVVPGLPRDFPPLRAAETPFAGRESELAAGARGAVAPQWYRRRGLLAGALAGVIAAAVAIPIFALAGGSRGGGGESRVTAASVALLDAASGELTREVAVPGSPGAVAVGEGAVWVTDASANAVSKVNLGSDEVNDTIPVGNGPTAITVGGGAVWVANGLDGTVSRIDPTTGNVTPIPVGNTPAGITFADGAVWVVNATDRTVSKIDADRSKVVGRPLRADAAGPGIAVVDGVAWVTDQASRTVARIDLSSERPIPVQLTVGNGPTGIAFGGDSIWVANNLDGTVSRIDPATNLVGPAIPVGVGPDEIAFTSDSVWVTNEFGGAVARLDPASGRPIGNVQTGSRPTGVAASGEGVWLSVAAGGAEHRGGTLRVRSGGLDSIDPAVAYSLESWSALLLTHDGLVAFRRAGGAEGTQLVPNLATSLPVPTDGGRTYTFRVRSGVRYSDGTPVRASDFRWAIERAFALQSAGAPAHFYESIVGAQACGQRGGRCDLSRGIVADDAARTVTIRLTERDPEFFFKLALPFAFAVPKTIGLREAKTPVPGTGPYVVAGYERDRSLRLVRNDRFRAWSHAAQPGGYPDEIDWKLAAGSGSETSAVVAGIADLALTPAREELDQLRVQHPGQLHLNLQPSTLALNLNTRLAPFDNPDARRAFNYAVDRAVTTRLAGGALSARPTCQILPANFPGYRRYCPYDHDLARATRLVARSGTRGTAVTVWSSPGVPAGVQLGRYAVSVLKLLGYRASLKVVADGGRYFAALHDPRQRIQILLNGWIADYSSPAKFFEPNFGCLSPDNFSRFCDRSVERGIRRALRVQANESALAAADLWARVDRQIVDAAPWVPLANWIAASVVSKRVGNYQYSPQWGVLVDQLWVK